MNRMSDSWYWSVLDDLFSASSIRDVFAVAAEQLGRRISLDVCLIFPSETFSQKQQISPVEWSSYSDDGGKDRELLKVCEFIESLSTSLIHPLVISEVSAVKQLQPIASELQTIGARSLIAHVLRMDGEVIGTVIGLSTEERRSWMPEQLETFQDLAKHVVYATKLIANNRGVKPKLPVRREESLSVSKGASATLATDRDGTIITISPAFEQQLRISKEDILGRNITSFLGEIVSEAEWRSVTESYDAATTVPETDATFLISASLPNSPAEELTQVGLRVVSTEGGEEEEEKFLHYFTIFDDAAMLRGRVDDDSASHYRAMVESSDALFLRINNDFTISFVSERSIDFFGVSPHEITTTEPVSWLDLVHLEDRPQMEERLHESIESSTSFEEEFRVINHVTSQIRWMLGRFVPKTSPDGKVINWDGFAVDITTRREAQDALNVQSKRVRALFTVSAAIRGFLDPANIASRGLAALCDATGASAGLCFLYERRKLRQLSLVAHIGLQASVAEKVADTTNTPNLSDYVAQNGQPIVVSDIRTDPRASKLLADEEGLRAAVLVPIVAEDEILGTLALFSKDIGSFDGSDVMLVSAAANQIGLAARQANLFTAYKEQTRNLSALYRMSRELSQHMPLGDIFQTAFSVVREELGVQRLWLGLLNEPGTRIIGQAAYGSGWKRRLVQVNVEVSDRSHPIARIIHSRKPLVIDRPDDLLREFGMRKVFSRLGIHSVALVPLISSGQVLGVLAVQPEDRDQSLNDEQMTLLFSLANEVAAAILTHRLEERIAESERMRTSGLLAAGIAHNFNNLLQAIVGQASLMSMEPDASERVKKAADRIQDAANRGAGLVKQLSSFAHLEDPKQEVLNVNEVIKRVRERVVSQLPKEKLLELHLQPNIAQARFDPSQLQRIIVGLIENAIDATDGEGAVEVTTSQVTVNRASPQYEVPFGTYVLIGVRDYGKGMDAETKRRCFEPFFTTRDVDPGSGVGISGGGLGLASTYALVKKNGGRIVVDSRLGHGSLFTVYLPVAYEDSLATKLERSSVSLDTDEREKSEDTLGRLPYLGRR